MNNSVQYQAGSRAFKGVVEYVDDWFLMGSPWPVLALWLAYMAFVLKLGPAYMANRKAFELRTALVIYNICQVVLSGYIFYLGVYTLYSWGLDWSYCAMETKETQYYGMICCHMYLLAKLSEFLDTVFFILRKKKNQVTFLHVYHHSFTMLGTWNMMKFNPIDSVIFIGGLNSLVHVVMYGYYGLSAFPSLTKYLWWKKYITSLQLIQFGMMILYIAANTYVSKCRASFVLIYGLYFNIGLLLYLFSNFYIKAYLKKDVADSSNIALENNVNNESKGNSFKIRQRMSVVASNNLSDVTKTIN